MQGGKGDTDVKNRLLAQREKARGDDLREQRRNTYITKCETDGTCKSNA